MVTQKIKDIDPRKIKEAKPVMAALELLGLDESDLLLLKEIPQMKAELAELRLFRESQIRAMRAEGQSRAEKPLSQQMSEMFSQKTEEFYPDGR